MFLAHSKLKMRRETFTKMRCILLIPLYTIKSVLVKGSSSHFTCFNIWFNQVDYVCVKNRDLISSLDCIIDQFSHLLCRKLFFIYLDFVFQLYIIIQSHADWLYAQTTCHCSAWNASEFEFSFSYFLATSSFIYENHVIFYSNVNWSPKRFLEG